jgi:hypothetical protein
MQVVHERCTGLDVHKRTVVVCVIVPKGREVHTFGTMTRELLEMVDWLLGKRVTHVAMESSGLYWRAPLQPA